MAYVNGATLLKLDTFTAINLLKRHISAGCLSRFPGIIPNQMPKERIQDPEQADHWEVDTWKISQLCQYIVPLYRNYYLKKACKR